MNQPGPLKNLSKNQSAEDPSTELRSENQVKLRSEFVPVFLQLLPKDIVYLKGILESYDELGVLRTLDVKSGSVVILAIADLKPELDKLLDALHGELDFKLVSSPPDWDEGREMMGDWLVDS